MGTGVFERLVMWCEHVGSRGTLVTHLSWEEVGRGEGGWSKPSGQREWKQFRYVLLIIVSKEPGVARRMMT